MDFDWHVSHLVTGLRLLWPELHSCSWRNRWDTDTDSFVVVLKVEMLYEQCWKIWFDDEDFSQSQSNFFTAAVVCCQSDWFDVLNNKRCAPSCRARCFLQDRTNVVYFMNRNKRMCVLHMALLLSSLCTCLSSLESQDVSVCLTWLWTFETG